MVAEGPHAGLGHLSRSSAVAVALRQSGIQPTCLVNGCEEVVERYGVVWNPVGRAAGPGASVLVLDSYEVPASEAGSSFDFSRLVIFGDHGESPGEADLVLSGLQYACVGPEFWDAPPREIEPELGTVIVSTGRGDTISTGVELAAQIRAELPQTRVGVVAPEGSEAPDGVELLGTPGSLFDPLRDADLAITAGGQTMLEAAAVGTPCIAVPLAANQRPQAEGLAEAGAVQLVELEDSAKLAAAAAALSEDLEARTSMSRAAQAAVDGDGARRAAAVIADSARGPA
jgi:spore coat polysaccharide biosynthesis predicted glycosyltransferase SpsG